MDQKTPINAVGIHLAFLRTMRKTPVRNIMLAVGIFVALIVILMFNAAILADHTTSVENPVNRINELAQYSIPNLIFHIF